MKTSSLRVFFLFSTSSWAYTHVFENLGGTAVFDSSVPVTACGAKSFRPQVTLVLEAPAWLLEGNSMGLGVGPKAGCIVIICEGAIPKVWPQGPLFRTAWESYWGKMETSRAWVSALTGTTADPP